MYFVGFLVLFCLVLIPLHELSKFPQSNRLTSFGAYDCCTSVVTDSGLCVALVVAGSGIVSFVLPRGRVPWMQKLRGPLVGAQCYQRFPLSKPVVGQNIALDAVPAYKASTSSSFIPTLFLPSRLIQLYFLKISPNLRQWNVF